MFRTTLVFSAIFALIASAALAAPTVDGVLSSGEWNNLNRFYDPIDNSPGHVEIVEWGVAIESGTLYAYFKMDPNGYNASQWWTGSGGTRIKMFPGIWVDTDVSNSTLLRGDTHQGGEWGGTDNPHQGVDQNCEFGGPLTWPDGEGYNFWCKYEGDSQKPTVDAIGSAVSGQVAYSGYVIEMSVPVASLISATEAEWKQYDSGFESNDPTAGGYWKLSLANQGNDYGQGTWSWGYDYGKAILVKAGEYDGRTVNGDINKDGKVDTADYTLWADNYTGDQTLAEKGYSKYQQYDSWSYGDLNADGKVDTADYTLWADNYGAGGSGESFVMMSGGVTTTTTPEPSTLVLLATLAAFAGLGLWRRRHG